ncbi:V-type ATPase subunit [Candidatus Micrarchaeota archaeon]|nr:V-type ATPase subunit [Candidatus Micrarchaeota archaeon]
MISLYLPYGYANARTKAMKSKLLNQDKVNSLLAVQSVQEVIELLQDTPYQEELTELSAKHRGVELVNQSVSVNFNKTMKKLARFIPKNGARDLFDLVMEEWAMQNLKAIIAAKAGGAAITESNLVLFTNDQVQLFNAVKDLDLEKTMKKLSFNYSFSPVFQKIEKIYKELKDYRAVFKELDLYYYSKLGRAAEAEKDYATKVLLRARIDFLNDTMVARLKLAGMPNEEIADNVITSSPRVKHVAMKLIQKETAKEVIEEIVSHHKLDASIIKDFEQTNSLVKLEVELERTLMQRALRISKVSVLSFSVILAYIYLKQEETRFIKAIAYSTQAGISQEMKNLVFAVK